MKTIYELFSPDAEALSSVRTMTTYDPDRRIWSGPTVAPLFGTDRSTGEVLLELLERNPEKPVQIDAETDHVMTRAELRLRAVRIAQHLKLDFGYGINDIATIAAMSSENLTPITVALQCNAIAYNALDPDSTACEMAVLMRKTQSRLMFCEVRNYETVRKAAREAVSGDVRIFILDGSIDGVPSVEELLVETGKEQEFKPEYLKDPSKVINTIFCSSGSTGQPKQICLSHSNKLSTYSFGNITNLRLLAMGCISWMSVSLTHELAIFLEGVVVITRRPFSEDLFFDLVEKYKINTMNGPPIYAYNIAHHPRAKTADLSSIMLWGIGGYCLSDEVRETIDALLPSGGSYVVYGISEGGLIASDLMKNSKPGSVGPLIANIQIRVVDEEDRPLGVGELGELLIKKPFPFSGYFKNEEATRAVLDCDGWFRSGDLGYFDEEGYLHLKDRKDDTFKYINPISPIELEKLIKQVDGVQEACVVGIPVKDESGRFPTAVVVRTVGSAVTEDTIKQFVAERVADHKQLRGGVFFVEHLPMTFKGNIKRKEVKQMLLDKLIS